MPTEIRHLEKAWLLLPLSVPALAFIMIGHDAWPFLTWWLALLLTGLAAWPLACRLFPSADRGYLLAKPLGLVLASLPLWLLAHLRLVPLSTLSALLAVLACALFLQFWSYTRHSYQDVFREPKTRFRQIGIEETFFAACLLLWTFARGLKPELDSLEKFMNIGFMNSIWRSGYLPASDMWFAGSQINYYYYGHYLYTFLARLTDIRPEIAYNLALATTFALTAGSAFSFAHHALQRSETDGHRLYHCAPVAGGLLAAILAAGSGNTHAFFYYAGNPGHALLGWLHRQGWIDSDPLKTFWFADSTRFIGYNPPTQDKTIHEFPYYSFLVADLHAHVINLALVLLLLTCLLYLVKQPHPYLQPGQNEEKVNRLVSDQQWHRAACRQMLRNTFRTIRLPQLILVGILLSLFMMTNYWDFVIYLVVTACVLLFWNTRGSGRLMGRTSLFVVTIQAVLVLAPYLLIEQPWLALLAFAAALLINHYLTILTADGLTLTGAQISGLFFFSHLLALPFNQSFEPIAKSVARSVDQSPPWQLLMLWGAHVLAAFCCLACGFWLWKRRLPVNRLPQTPWERYAVTLPGNWAERAVRLTRPADGLALVMLLAGLGLILVPEVIYVVDIYSGDFKRANTMFKFTYQAFVLLSLVWAYGLTVLALHRSQQRKGRTGRTLTALLLCLLLIVPLSYTPVSTRQWLGQFQTGRYRGLDGLRVFADKDSAQVTAPYNASMAPDHDAIRWFNEQVQGTPVILEAYGDSYTDFCRISAFTGLPTVMGWQTHQWLWRTSKRTPQAYGSVVLPRQQDVRAIYTTEDPEERHALIEHYDIRYLVIGNLERSQFSEPADSGELRLLIQEEMLRKLGPVVFESGDLYIIRLNR